MINLRIVTINICNVSPGGNMIQGVMIYFVSNLISLIYILNLKMAIFSKILLVIFSYYFINVHLAYILGLILKGLSDFQSEQFKKQRIDLLFHHIRLQNPDIICLQEVNLIYGLNKYQNLIIQKALELGFKYHCSSVRYPKFPCLFSVGGMMILSKYQIINDKFHIYNHLPFQEIPIVTRGFLHAQIKIKNQIFNVINVHTSSGNQIFCQTFNLKNQDLKIFDQNNSHGLKQFEQIFQLVKQLDQNIIVAGDFNAKSGSNDYNYIKTRFQLHNIKDCYYEFNKEHKETFGVLKNNQPIETLITRKSDQGKMECLDYIFSNLNCIKANVNHFQTDKMQKWQQVSDHSAIIADLFY